jgi:hypothetical protein
VLPLRERIRYAKKPRCYYAKKPVLPLRERIRYAKKLRYRYAKKPVLPLREETVLPLREENALPLRKRNLCLVPPSTIHLLSQHHLFIYISLF